ncbi:MAG: N-acetyl-D-myo-inositol-2-amino-2-deoxy-alpha-D-glucopyranoside deacetylase [Pseudonocardiales bacterium]|jgi:N-acetyl-1-D-myo-inositol-2-amino-2-deoxy-alpha-D-glucopyranoside deacetylase|nr:N-acetyl-D-myo-inositol-2-amino-2-deoxy-alpha-D-glucopyranoside deacetylase [Pseudonocardiales bacterium]
MSRRLLLLHAHPDDESITTGATMARYAAEGAHVTLVTCTLGEEGEVLLPELAQLEAAQADQLGGYRMGELAEAMRWLGVSDHRFLGGAGRFRDSGMMDTQANAHPRAFWRADSDPDVFDAAVTAAVQIIRELRPQVLVTYDDNGDYGHPDHVMAHRVASAAVERAAEPGFGAGEPWRVAKVYWTATPTSLVRAGAESPDNPFGGADTDELPFGVDDALITTIIDASAYGAAKLAALAAHRTQIAVDGPFFALSNMLGRKALPVEHFRLRSGTMGPDRDAEGRETDLFSGVST